MMEIVMTRCDKKLRQLDMMANWYDDMWQKIVTSLCDKNCDDECDKNCDNKTWWKIVTTRHNGKLWQQDMLDNCDKTWCKIVATRRDKKLWQQDMMENCDKKTWPSSFKIMFFIWSDIPARKFEKGWFAFNRTSTPQIVSAPRHLPEWRSTEWHSVT